VLTFFTTAKPFRGNINVIQRNALKSWTLLHADIEVIVFGDDDGTTEVAREFGIRHEPDIERTQFGAIRLDSMFQKAQMIARHEVLCYVNCDIILLSDFRVALERVRNKYRPFLMVGRRWDTPITEPIDFSDPRWDEKVGQFAISTNNRRDEWWIDYFAFSRGFYGTDIPPLGVGRGFWDDWLMWRGLQSKYPVVDATSVIVAVHQDHDYSHHPSGTKGVREGEETKQNLLACGGWNHMRTISDATFVLSPAGFARNSDRYWRALTKPWRLGRDRDEFQLRTPGRFRYFVHRCRVNLVFGSTMTRADLTYRWAYTFFELIVGRERSHYLEGVRTRVRRLFRYVARRFRSAEQGNVCP
jgi:hypothetical protein